jgi:hypothetical protein
MVMAKIALILMSVPTALSTIATRMRNVITLLVHSFAHASLDIMELELFVMISVTARVKRAWEILSAVTTMEKQDIPGVI